MITFMDIIDILSWLEYLLPLIISIVGTPFILIMSFFGKDSYMTNVKRYYNDIWEPFRKEKKNS